MPPWLRACAVALVDRSRGRPRHPVAGPSRGSRATTNHRSRFARRFIRSRAASTLHRSTGSPLSDIGTDMSRWVTEKHITSGDTLALENKNSGGRLRRGCEFVDTRGDKPPRGDTAAGETTEDGISP